MQATDTIQKRRPLTNLDRKRKRLSAEEYYEVQSRERLMKEDIPEYTRTFRRLLRDRDTTGEAIDASPITRADLIHIKADKELSSRELAQRLGRESREVRRWSQGDLPMDERLPLSPIDISLSFDGSFVSERAEQRLYDRLQVVRFRGQRP